MGSSKKVATGSVDSEEGGGSSFRDAVSGWAGGGAQPLTLASLEARVKEGAGGPQRKKFLHHKRRKARQNGSPFRAAERRGRGRPAQGGRGPA